MTKIKTDLNLHERSGTKLVIRMRKKYMQCFLFPPPLVVAYLYWRWWCAALAYMNNAGTINYICPVQMPFKSACLIDTLIDYFI